jgi:uncharacterized protein YbjT (DUF2867 family)
MAPDSTLEPDANQNRLTANQGKQPITYQGVFFYPFPRDFPIPMVATRDISITATKWLRNRDWSGQSGVAVHEPEDLSLARAAEIFSEVFSKSVRFQPVPPEAERDSMLKHDANPAFAQSQLDMFAEVAAPTIPV